jgi:hypothetical protein
VNTSNSRTILAAGFVGWFLCFATMGMGMALLSLDNALIVHAIAAPIFFGAVSFVYFTRFGHTKPLTTAANFVAFVIAMDFFVVALLINRSLEMFTSPIGTWIPFGLIFVSTYAVGRYVSARGPSPARAQITWESR